VGDRTLHQFCIDAGAPLHYRKSFPTASHQNCEQAGKIGLTHGPIQSLGMNEGGQTDDFKVKDGLVFNALKVGDKIRFAVERVNGEPTITKIEK
jgi:Cu/Ag efflux protein CusF